MQRLRNLEDLYNMVKPALSTKMSDLHKEKYVMIKEENIWNYLLEKKWILEDNLELSSIVDDILNADGYKISKYMKESNKTKEEL